MSAAETTEAFVGLARFAALAGLPLPKDLTAEITGTDPVALARLARTAELLARGGVRHERADTETGHRLVIHAGAGVSLTITHQRSPESPGRAVWAKEAEVACLEDLYEGLRSGSAGWRQWNDELTCAGRQDVAAEECATALDQARRELAGLTRGTAATERPGNGGTR